MIHYPVQDPSRTAAAYQIVSPIQTADWTKIFRTGPRPAQDRGRTGAGPAHGTKLLPRYKQAEGRRTGAGRVQTGAGREQHGGRTGATAWGPCEVI